jgi:hypothetical protein
MSAILDRLNSGCLQFAQIRVAAAEVPLSIIFTESGTHRVDNFGVLQQSRGVQGLQALSILESININSKLLISSE